MKIIFRETRAIRERTNGANPKLLSEAEIHFEKGEPLEGLKLIGFRVWSKDNGRHEDLFVTMPSKAFNVGDARQYIDFLRSGREKREDVHPLKNQILDAYLDYEKEHDACRS